MLDNPVLDNPVNLEAATMFKKRPLQYKQMVLDCVFTSKQLEGMQMHSKIVILVFKQIIHSSLV